MRISSRAKARPFGWSLLTFRQPYYCLDIMRAIVSEAARGADGIVLDEASSSAAFRTMSDRTSDLALAIGGSIRVRATGLPVTYDTFFDVLLSLFFATEPALVEIGGWFWPRACPESEAIASPQIRFAAF